MAFGKKLIQVFSLIFLIFGNVACASLHSTKPGPMILSAKSRTGPVYEAKLDWNKLGPGMKYECRGVGPIVFSLGRVGVDDFTFGATASGQNLMQRTFKTDAFLHINPMDMTYEGMSYRALGLQSNTRDWQSSPNSFECKRMPILSP